MNALKRFFYSISFRARFLEKNGDEFQKFFADIMSKCYPGDFFPTRPWGNMGDGWRIPLLNCIQKQRGHSKNRLRVDGESLIIFIFVSPR